MNHAAIDRLMHLLEEHSWASQVQRDAPLAQYTSFGIGGPADLLMIARTRKDLVNWLMLARKAGAPAMVLGSGTNVLVADAGVRGLVVINATSSVTLTVDGLLVADSGVLLGELAQEAIDAGWEGLEWAIGVPGTLGGAIVGNAGAYGGCMADNVRWARLLQPDGGIVQVSLEALCYGYRTSALKRITAAQERPVVLEAALQLRACDAAAVRARADDYTRRRLERTPRGNSAGSMFKRTLQYPAGYLIDQAGLKGLRIGDAMVSTVHANFMMNAGSATAADMRQLVQQVQQVVWQKYGQRLVPEVEFVGQWPDASAPTVGQPLATNRGN